MITNKDPFHGELKNHPEIKSIVAQAMKNVKKTGDYYKEVYIAVMAGYTAGLLDSTMPVWDNNGEIQVEVRKEGGGNAV